MGRVHVVMVNQTFLPDPVATSQYMGPLARDLVERGHRVTVLCSRQAYARPGSTHPARETWQGVEICRVRATALGRGAEWSRLVDFATFAFGVFWRGLFLPKPDVILSLTTPPLISVIAALLAILRRARFVYWVMDLNPDEAVAAGWLAEKGLLTRVLQVLSRWCMRHAERIVVLDRFMRDRLMAQGVDGSKIEVVPLWMLEDARFDAEGRDRFRAVHGLAEKFVVMHAGNHTPCHPLETLLGAAVALRHESRFHFCFVGGGSEWGKLRERASAAGLANVTFLSYQEQSGLAGLLSAADLQVVAMGAGFVGIIHPCKVYNFLAAERPFLYLGPKESHVADLIRETWLEDWTSRVEHGEVERLVGEIRRQGESSRPMAWPRDGRFAVWSQKSLLEKMSSVLLGS